MRALADHLRPVQLLAPQVQAATLTSLVLDTQGWDVAAFLLNVGAPGGGGLSGSNKSVPKIQHSDTLTEAAFADAAAATYQDRLWQDLDSATAGNRAQFVAYTGTKRYIRIVLTVTGTVSVPLAATGLLGGPQKVVAGLPDVGLAIPT